MNNQTAAISNKLRTVTIGILITCLTSLVYLLNSLDIISYINNDLYKVLCCVDVAGVLIASFSLFAAARISMRIGIPGRAFILCASGMVLCAIHTILNAFVPSYSRIFVHMFNEGIDKGILLDILSNIVKILPVVIGTMIAGRILRSLRIVSVIYVIAICYPIINLLIEKLCIRQDYGYYGYEINGVDKFFILTSIINLLLGIIEVTLWGKSCTKAEKLEGKKAEGTGAKCSPAVVIEQSPAAQPASTQTAAQPATASAAKSPVTDEQKKLIMGMSDEELTKVVNNPMLYANPAFVEEARSTLLKRQAWEMIKDYSDMQLLDIVHNNTQGFAYEVLDASSMELLARETEEFVNEIRSLSTEQLQGIVSNPDSYFDGYVRLATRILNERLNNSEKE